jgi:hypothetical protein
MDGVIKDAGILQAGSLEEFVGTYRVSRPPHLSCHNPWSETMDEVPGIHPPATRSHRRPRRTDTRLPEAPPPSHRANGSLRKCRMIT